MLFVWLASVLFVVLLVNLFRIERQTLLEGRARGRALILDGARLTAALLMFLALPYAEPRPQAAIGLGLAALAFVALPSSWILTLGGQDPKWELRKLQSEAAELMSRRGTVLKEDDAVSMKAIVKEVVRLRTAETAELCDLLIARYEDWLSGSHRPLTLGRRSIRIYDLQRELYGDEVRPPELDEQEATFRWHLYRVFGEMVEAGVADPTPEQRSRFIDLVDELDTYRREDTGSFIDGLQVSARAWLENPGDAGWQPGVGIAIGEPDVDEAGRQLWPRTSVFWGAILDEEDRREILPVRDGNREMVAVSEHS
jgi:hypothetical protein